MDTLLDPTTKPPPAAPTRRCRIAVIGAGPVGLSLALLLATRTTHTEVCVFDARPADKDVSGDGRTLALSLGSVQLLERLQAWDGTHAQPIHTVHVSQQPPTMRLPEGLPFIGSLTPTVTIRASDVGVEQLGAVLPYGALVPPLQRAWMQAAAAAPGRLGLRFGAPVTGIKPLLDGSVEVDAGVAEVFDLAVIAEGGVFADGAQKVAVSERTRAPLTHDYAQTAWVGTVHLLDTDTAPVQSVAVERFTRHGPAALLPLPPKDGVRHRAAIVWCVPTHSDPARDLDDAQRVAVLNTLFPSEVVRPITALAAPLKAFPLGLSAQRTLVDQGAAIVRIGNAAQTLHPVAGQGLNLGLRDAYALADALRLHVDTHSTSLVTQGVRVDALAVSVSKALRSVEWQRGPDRWALIAGTDFLARSFTWGWPGFGAARGAALALLDKAGPLKNLLARQMMFGGR
jgi:2-octaprenyl-6-methoxyphenol hydroxylase